MTNGDTTEDAGTIVSPARRQEAWGVIERAMLDSWTDEHQHRRAPDAIVDALIARGLLADQDATTAADALRAVAQAYRAAHEAGYLFLGDGPQRVPWEAVAQDLDERAARLTREPAAPSPVTPASEAEWATRAGAVRVATTADAAHRRMKAAMAVDEILGPIPKGIADRVVQAVLAEVSS